MLKKHENESNKDLRNKNAAQTGLESS